MKNNTVALPVPDASRNADLLRAANALGTSASGAMRSNA